MVVIESSSNGAEEEDQVTQKNMKSTDEKIGGSEVEGYETASDGEVEGEGEGESSSEGKSAPPLKDDSYEDALNDEQLNQRALTQANDAKAEGNKLFGIGQYEDALSQYELALEVAAEMPSSVEGRYEDTIKECTKALGLNPTYMKALVRRGEAHEKLEHFEEAIADLKKIIELDPSNDQARRTIRRLEPLAAEKREKMKEEMIGKLKEMGNSVLGRFGMSVDNFKAVKDPNTGSYSLSFQR